MDFANEMRARVLLIEDDPAVRNILKAAIDYGGFDSSEAGSAFEALGCLRDQQFDSVLLDLGLPDAEGGHLINEIRKTSDVPILVVSGDRSEQSKISALDAGADDFLEKPFLPGELLARIRAAMRRGAPGRAKVRAEPQSFRGGNGLGTARRAAKHGSKEQKLLEYLLQSKGALVTNEDIISAIWHADDQRTERNVRVLVAMLRRELEAERSTLEIVNEHGRGYRLRDRATG